MTESDALFRGILVREARLAESDLLPHGKFVRGSSVTESKLLLVVIWRGSVETPLISVLLKASYHIPDYLASLAGLELNFQAHGEAEPCLTT